MNIILVSSLRTILFAIPFNVAQKVLDRDSHRRLVWSQLYHLKMTVRLRCPAFFSTVKKPKQLGVWTGGMVLLNNIVHSRNHLGGWWELLFDKVWVRKDSYLW